MCGEIAGGYYNQHPLLKLGRANSPTMNLTFLTSPLNIYLMKKFHTIELDGFLVLITINTDTHDIKFDAIDMEQAEREQMQQCVEQQQPECIDNKQDGDYYHDRADAFFDFVEEVHDEQFSTQQ